jgi:predicted RNA-binding protein with PUA-like domain
MSWLFQSVPKRYDLASEMKSGQTETWLVTRYGSELKKGDIVFLWMAGPPAVRGLYGWGRIADETTRYYKNWGSGIDVHYEKKFTEHISFSEVRALKSFADHVLFKTAVGTNFRLSSQQTEELRKLIVRKHGAGAAP